MLPCFIFEAYQDVQARCAPLAQSAEHNVFQSNNICLLPDDLMNKQSTIVQTFMLYLLGLVRVFERVDVEPLSNLGAIDGNSTT